MCPFQRPPNHCVCLQHEYTSVCIIPAKIYKLEGVLARHLPTNEQQSAQTTKNCTTYEFAALFNFARGFLGSTLPRKIGLNWFIPEFAKRRVGSSWGTTGDDTTNVCSRCSKNSTKVFRTRDTGQAILDVVGCCLLSIVEEQGKEQNKWKRSDSGGFDQWSNPWNSKCFTAKMCTVVMVLDWENSQKKGPVPLSARRKTKNPFWVPLTISSGF